MRKSVKNLLAAVVSVVLLAPIVSGCSDKNKGVSEIQAAKQQAGSQTGGGEQDMTRAGESHWGDKCRVHYYYVAPGESSTLTFEKAVDATLAKTAGEEEPTVRKEELEAVGYSVSYRDRSVDTFSVSFPIWVLSEPDFAVKDNERILYAPLNGWRVRWNRNGEGIIEGVSGANGKFAVGKLTLDKLLGRRKAVEIKGPNGSIYSLTPVQKTVTEEFHILSATFDVTAPRETVLRQDTKSAGVSWKGGGIGFDRVYDRTNERYVISGPATSRDCFE